MAKKKTIKKTKKAEAPSFTIKLDLKAVVVALVVLNLITIFMWKPWQDNGAPDRTISVSGDAVVEAEPDLYKFNPSYNIEADSQEAVLEKATAKANEVIDGLKDIGVEEKDIKLDASSYGNWWYDETEDVSRTSVYISIDVDNKEQAQEVQDFLLTTDPEGQITPWPTFSEEMQDELEIEARELAIADARQKAEQSAKELGLSVGKVVSVNEGYAYGGIDVAYAEVDVARNDDISKVSSLPIQPGENEYNFSVTVVFEIK